MSPAHRGSDPCRSLLGGIVTDDQERWLNWYSKIPIRYNLRRSRYVRMQDPSPSGERERRCPESGRRTPNSPIYYEITKPPTTTAAAESQQGLFREDVGG